MNITDLDTKKKFIAFRIRAILEKKGWTQQQLADAMGTHKSYISKILAGEQNMTLEGISSIEHALDVPILDVDITNDEKKEYTEEVVFTEFLKASKLPISDFKRGKQIDFIAKHKILGSIEVNVGIDLQSYQHTANVTRRMEFKQEIISRAQEKFAEIDDSELVVTFHFRDDFPPQKKMGKAEKEKLVNKIVAYVKKYAHNYERENNSVMAMRLYEQELDSIFFAISIYDGFNHSFWNATQGGWFSVTISDVVDEIERRVRNKNEKIKGYGKNDPCDEYWLLMYHEGDSISDINLAEGMSIEAKNRLDEIARMSPFSRIYIFDPYWSVKFHAIKE